MADLSAGIIPRAATRRLAIQPRLKLAPTEMGHIHLRRFREEGGLSVPGHADQAVRALEIYGEQS